jgi:hypothetical protein
MRLPLPRAGEGIRVRVLVALLACAALQGGAITYTSSAIGTAADVTYIESGFSESSATCPDLSSAGCVLATFSDPFQSLSPLNVANAELQVWLFGAALEGGGMAGHVSDTEVDILLASGTVRLFDSFGAGFSTVVTVDYTQAVREGLTPLTVTELLRYNSSGSQRGTFNQTLSLSDLRVDAALTVNYTPEPAAWVLVGGGLLLVCGRKFTA